MAVGDAINSDMAKTLLRKIKGQDPIPKKKDTEEEMALIIKKLGDIQNSLETDSKEAEQSRKLLINQLINKFDEKGLSIKEQKDILTSVNENLHETMDVLKTLNLGNINKFFTTISNPKLLGEAINKGFASSNISKALDVIPQMISNISSRFSKVFAWGEKIVSFLSNPIDYLKSFGKMIIQETTDYVKKQFVKMASFVWNSAIKPLMASIGRLTASVVTIGIDITAMLIRMAAGFVVWMVTTIVPMLGSILGFIVFTIVPMLFSVISAIAGAVLTITAALTPILLVTAAILIIGILLGYLLYKTFDAVKEFVNYIFSEKFIEDIKAGFIWVWDNIVLPVWDALKWTFENVIVPTIKWLGEAFMWSWDNIAKPLFEWLQENLPIFWDSVLVPTFTWLAESFMWSWENIMLPTIEWLGEAFMWSWENVVSPLLTWIGDVLVATWPILIEGFNYVKEMIGKIFSAVNMVGEGLGEVASTVTGGLSKAWDWTTSWFASGGIVTKPTNAIIGEGGVSEAVIPLNKQGMQFIRDSFQIDDMAVQQVVKNSDLFKTQTKMQVTIEGIAKDIKQIKFSLNEIKKENKIQNPPEVLVATIKTDKLPQGDDIVAIFDIEEIEKLIENSDELMLKKLEELMTLIKANKTEKTDPLLNPGMSPVDSYHDLLKIISTGVLGVR